MIFALGVLAATLIALMIIPAINARAERLARRRAEALFPMSISELTAEKDHLRAEFAVLQRRIERKADEAQAIKHQTLEELGRRAVRIEELTTTLAQRDATVSGLETDLADTRARLAATEDDLAGTKTSLSGTRDTLAAIEDAHRKTLDELASTRAELERTKTALAGTRAELSLTQEKLATQEAEYADLDRRHTAALSELDTKRITISDIETRLGTQTARGDEFERSLSARRSELSEERQRLADFAKNLLAEQERGLVLEQRIREIEAERDDKASEVAALAVRLEDLSKTHAELQAALDERSASALATEKDLADARIRIAALEADGGASGDAHASELRSLAERTETLKAEKATLEGALSTAREERARLEKEVMTLRRSGGATSEDIQAENAELRRRIAEVADEVLRATNGAQRSGKRRQAGR
jgi:predicted  nucleic acid-binding Zn-ribbon protein